MTISNIKNKINRFILLLNIGNNKKAKFTFTASIVLIVISIISYHYISTNGSYYKKTIARITSLTETEDSKVYDMNGVAEQAYKQEIKAVVINGFHKGKEIRLKNKFSYSQAFDLRFNVDDEVFVSLTEDSNKRIVSSSIIDFKRDKYISYIAILFILLIIFIGGFRGIRSLTSVAVNIIIFLAAFELYIHGCNLIMVSSIASIFFIIISITLVSGINKKTVSAVIGTMVGTLLSMLISVIVIMVTNKNGLHFEEMEFMTRPPEQIFFAGVLIGTLGGIMDIAITISSSLNELYDKNPDIDIGKLIKSGTEIGKDIMGTMSNTLVFAYISGSIPMILLWMKNGYSTFYIIKYNICLEIIRALTGSIGIVLSIPITIYISILLLRRNKIGEMLES